MVSCAFLCASNEFDGSDLVRIRFGTPAGAPRRADFRVAPPREQSKSQDFGCFFAFFGTLKHVFASF